MKVATRAKSKRTVKKKEFVSKTGVTFTDNYCRRCMKDKLPKDFYQAVDFDLDSNGVLSICKTCCIELYDNILLTERTLDKTILRMCRMLNIIYDENVVNSVRKELNNAQKSDRKPKHPFSIYRARVSTMLARSGKMEDDVYFDLTFFEPQNLEVSEESLSLMSHDKFWGENYTLDEIEFLDMEYTNFKQNYATDDHATVVLLKRVCKKLLAINNLETEGGKGVGTLEKFTPAEWMETEGKDLHHDVDDVANYYENYVVRPLRNFFSGNADYGVSDEKGNITDESI